MSCSCQETGTQLCGCCSGITQTTPAAIANRPGLPAIQYRVGTWSTFLETMLASLSSSSVPALAGLRTRSPQDFSIALIDAWAEVLDILTFYTERLANEAWLGTAIETRSVFELARLVGYKPSPGVSASTVLAFTLASAPGSPAAVPIPAGTRVQSVPGPGQSPQVFETSSSLTGTIAANAMPAVTSQPWQLFGSDTSTWVAGTANNIQVGDALLVISAPGGSPAAGGPAAVVNVTAVSTHAASGTTWVAWDQPLPAGISGPEVCVYAFRTRAALFGANAPYPALFYSSGTLPFIPGAPSLSGEIISSIPDWNWQYPGNQTVPLDNAYPGLSPSTAANPTPDQLQWLALVYPGVITLCQVAGGSDATLSLYSLSAKSTQVQVSSATVLPNFTGLSTDLLLSLYVAVTRTITVLAKSQRLTGANVPLTSWAQSATYNPVPGMLAPVFGTSVVVQGLQALLAGAPVAISGSRVRIAATSPLSAPNGGFTPSGSTEMLAVSAKQPFLIDAFPPVADQGIAGNLLWKVLTVTGQAGMLSLPGGGFQLQPSASADPVAGEAALLSDVTVQSAQGGTTALTFEAALTRIYDRPTVRVNANAVDATHGETIMEILGSGDATNDDLEFQLKQSPLTYVSAPTASGIQSTLQVRVNNLLWSEVDNLLDSGPAERVYVTRPNASGGPTVQFGNGQEGSRTPTGVSNIQAKYRKGLGVAGMVAAGQLTQPLDRPQGLQSVTNPSAATGGADPASAGDARTSAPLPTLTLGRVVSLEDYQNFALNFGGIALALASWTWFGNTRGVFLTVAGAGGSILHGDDEVVVNLLSALGNFGLPYVPVQVVSYVPVLFEIAMQVKVDSPTYNSDLVLAQVWQSLAPAFAFGTMQPGQSVAASYAIQLAQQVPGVVAVNLTALNRSGDPAMVNSILCASGPQPKEKPPQGAEILLLDPASQGNVGVWA